MDWSDETEARLVREEERLRYKAANLQARGKTVMAAQELVVADDIRSALEEIERLAYLHDLDHKLADGYLKRAEKAEASIALLDQAATDYRKARDKAEAKLAEAERIVGLQNAALDVWKGAYPSDDSIHLAALAVAQGDRRLRVALEQIDRETRSASDVGLLRMGSIARAALRGGGE